MSILKSLFSVKGTVLAIASFVFCYARHTIQYDNPPWQNGLLTFLGSWLIHYIAVFFIAVIVLVILNQFGKYIFPDKDPNIENIEEIIIYVSLTIIAASVFILFAYYVGPYVLVDDIYE